MKKLQKVLALLGVAALLMLVFITLYFAITGSPYFMASMFCMIVVPVIIYGYIVVFRVVSGNKADKMGEEREEHKKK